MLLMHAIFSLVVSLALTCAANAQTCANPIACENQLAGDNGWEITGSGDTSIQGFATDISINAGETIDFKINTDAASYTVDIYRLGYYGGNGARKVATISPSASLPQVQPACLTNSLTKLVDCGNWGISASWHVPSTAVSGIYFARLARADSGGASHIVFIVRDDASQSDILYQTSDQTWQAYNSYGGYSLYGPAGAFDSSDRAFKVSYNRPFDTAGSMSSAWFFNAEYPMVRWLEANGYDVSYFTGIDASRRGALIKAHKIYLSVGQDSYASGPQRASIEEARDAGVNLAFFSGGEFFWKTRWENSIDGTYTSYRTLVCYRETLNRDVIDPADPPVWTGAWRDPRFSPPRDGGRPENALTGTLFMANSTPDANLSIQVPAWYGQLRFWRNTSIATLPVGQTAILPGGTLGYQWDTDIDNGFRPAGLVSLSAATYILANGLLMDDGATYGSGTVTHRMGLYRAPGGALVFGAGTVQWSWGLDPNHDNAATPADERMQQATVNLLADMDAQPATIQSPLIRATKSADTTPPTSAILTPNLSLQSEAATTIIGTATDSGGGVIGAVEVSVDGGQTWHPAAGRENWTYTWKPTSVAGSATLMVRAADDSANVQATPTTATFDIAGAPTVWTTLTVPDTVTHNDTDSVELGMKFQSDVAGYITGVRFYKGPNNTGPHIGNLWTTDGKRLASVTFADETPAGWQQAFFPSPVQIAPDTTYVISYYAPNGGYTAQRDFFNAGFDRPPLHALADNIDGPNGVFVYAAGGGFPTQTFHATNYWVDVIFSASNTAPHSVLLNWLASSSTDIAGYNLYRANVPGGAYEMLNTSPLTGTAYLDINIAPNRSYFYVVTAIDRNNNESGFSNEAVAVVPTP